MDYARFTLTCKQRGVGYCQQIKIISAAPTIIRQFTPFCSERILQFQEQKMAKGQQNSNKMVKKPKKDTAPAKPVSADAVRPTITTVVPVRGKLKNAPGKS